MNASDAFADRLAGGALGAISATKRAVNITLKRSMTELMDASLAWETATSRSADHQEAVRAFKEKREPDFPSHGHRALETHPVAWIQLTVVNRATDG